MNIPASTIHTLCSSNARDRSWKRIAFITHVRHVRDLQARGELDDVLLVSSDWLLWQQCANQQLACISIEEPLISSPVDPIWRRSLLLAANDWVYADDEDMTRFQGASVGKLFNTETTIALSAYLRIANAVNTIVLDHSPEQVIYYDIRAETNLISDALRHQTVLQLMAESGLDVIDRADPLSPSDPSQPMVMEVPVSTRPLLRRLATRLLTSAMALATNLVNFQSSRRRGTLIAVQQSICMPLLKMNAHALQHPVLWPEWMPKTPAFIKVYMRSRSRFMSMAIQKLSKAERVRYDAQISAGTRNWDAALTTAGGFIRHYALHEIIGTGRLLEMAHKVKTAAYRFRAANPKTLIVDGVKNYPHRTFLDLARESGCQTYYIWHAPLSSEHFGYDALGSDPRQPGLVDGMLGWGELEQEWLDALKVNIPVTRTGTPHMRPAETGHAEAGKRSRTLKRALVLDYSIIASDLGATNATKYEYFINIVRKLRAMGVEEIRFKLHPGRPNQFYYQSIAAYFSLDCTIHKSEPIEDMTDWADVVIGPVHSSSMMKVIARGKEYYAFLIPPTWQDGNCYRRLHVVTDIDTLETALVNRQHAGDIAALDHITSWSSVGNPVDEIWSKLDACA